MIDFNMYNDLEFDGKAKMSLSQSASELVKMIHEFENAGMSHEEATMFVQDIIVKTMLMRSLEDK